MGVYLGLIVASIIVVVILFLTYNIDRTTSTSTSSDIFRQIIHPTWAPGKKVSPCFNAYFPPTSANTLGTPSLNQAVLSSAVISPESVCVWSDTINAALYSRLCLTECVGLNGQSYSAGEYEDYVDTCDCETCNQPCSSDIVLIRLGTQCLSVTSQATPTTCNMQDVNQIFLAYHSQSRRLFNLQNRDNGQWLLLTNNGQLVLSGTQPQFFYWTEISPSVYLSGTGDVLQVPGQLVYLGYMDQLWIAQLDSLQPGEILDQVMANNCPSVLSSGGVNDMLQVAAANTDQFSSGVSNATVITRTVRS